MVRPLYQPGTTVFERYGTIRIRDLVSAQEGMPSRIFYGLIRVDSSSICLPDIYLCAYERGASARSVLPDSHGERQGRGVQDVGVGRGGRQVGTIQLFVDEIRSDGQFRRQYAGSGCSRSGTGTAGSAARTRGGAAAAAAAER